MIAQKASTRAHLVCRSQVQEAAHSSPDISGSCSPGRSTSSSCIETGRDRFCGVLGSDAWMTSLLRSVISLHPAQKTLFTH